jgi:hypothetical protein
MSMHPRPPPFLGIIIIIIIIAPRDFKWPDVRTWVSTEAKIPVDVFWVVTTQRHDPEDLHLYK